MSNLYWYRANPDGTADRFDNTPEIQAKVDARSEDELWTMSPEKAILIGHVQATAFTHNYEMTYDELEWLLERRKVEAGMAVVTSITAEPQPRLPFVPKSLRQPQPVFEAPAPKITCRFCGAPGEHTCSRCRSSRGEELPPHSESSFWRPKGFRPDEDAQWVSEHQLGEKA